MSTENLDPPIIALDEHTIRVRTTLGLQVAAHIPDTVRWQDHVDIPWTFENAEMCARLGAPAASPILRDYHWPAPFKPMPHQEKISSFMTLHPRGFVFSGMGTGKTLAAIWAIDYLRRLGRIKRVLVVAPMSIMEAAWGNDLFMSVTDQPYAVLHGSREKRIKALKLNAFWNIINPDGVEVIYNELLMMQFDAVVIDESRTYANPGTAMWKALKPLVDRAVYAWGMTGTPTPQGPMDAFGQCRMLVPDKVPRNKNQWQDMTMVKFSQFRWGVRENGWKTVQQAMQPAIRFEKKDVLKHLPPVTYRYVHVPLTASQEAYYAKLRDEMVAEAGAHTISAVHAGAKMIKLMQVASGAVYDDNGTALEFDVSPRIKVLKELIDQTSEGVLVFAPFLHTVAMLEKHLAPLGFKTITGETSLAERTKTISSLQAGEIKGILAIPQTLSHGVTLTAANLSIWFSCPSSTETYLQASNRMDRPGQKHAMQIIHLFGSQVERKRYDAVKNNDEAQNSMLDLYQAFVQGI